MPEVLPELVGVCSAPVPGVVGVRCDEYGDLWKWTGRRWQRLGRPGSPRVCVKLDSGTTTMRARRVLIASAWHGPRPAGWWVHHRDGPGLHPANLEWRQSKPGQRRKLDAGTQRLIRHRAANGEKLTALVREYGVNIATVCAVCKGYVPRGPSVAANRWLTADERRQIYAMSEAGVKQAVIAKRFRRCVNRVRAIIREEAAREEAERGKQS